MIAAACRGKLRDQFHSDVFHFGDAPDAARQVAMGYLALGTAAGWLIGAIPTAIAYPQQVEAHVLAVLAAILNVRLFGFIRQRRDPRPALDYMVPIYLIIVAIVQYRHTGFVAPIVVTMPVVAGVSAVYQRPGIRGVMAALTLVTMAFCTLSATGLIGEPSTADQSARAIMTIICVLATILGLGGLALMSALSRDYRLNQLKAFNDAVVENATRVHSALEAARVGLWDAPDVSQQRFILSDSFESVTGYTAAEFNHLFGNLEKFVHPDDIASLRAAFRAGRRDMSRIRADFRLKTRTRGYRWFSTRARYTRNASGVLRLAGSLQDVNVLKIAEETLRVGRDQARAADKAKSDFIAVMSHEVRTPLNAILGSVEVLRRGQHDEESHEMLDLIDEAGRGLLAIVNDMLDVSRIEAGRMELNPAPTDLALLLRRTVDFWRPAARDKGLSLEIDCTGADGAPLLMVDAGRIRQIVGNLLSNAIKYTDTGRITTTLFARTASNGRIDVSLSVIDTGPGVPDAIAETIFTAFEQGASNASRGGTGLGLFISRRLARMMGGDLTLEPARRNGAHFRFTLTAEAADPAAPAETHPDDLQNSWRGLRVLCVDDNEKNRRIIELLLGKLDLDITLCASGAEALDICVMQAFDLILMDIIMPDMSGVETLANLRKDAASLNRDTPAIALTAKVGPVDIATYLAAGFEGVSAKPISLSDLAREIARVLAARV